MSLFETLQTRGYIEQSTNEEEVKDILNNKKIKFYIGFDPTADSLHIGHFVTIMAMSHLQKAGHTPVALVGGGTGMIGDPTHRTDMRRVMTVDEIENNINKFKIQLSRFITFDDDKAIMVNNADWLLNLQYIPFLREYGIHFSVNRMLSADSYKSRLEQGLSFFEFNYMIMQAYDFLELNKCHDCLMQLGGRDQWSNILAGVDLIRRVSGKESYGLTLRLLETSEGIKMGKTAKGALWLDRDKTSPYEFYQYFRNIEDAGVINCLKLLTFVPMEEINELRELTGKDINIAKEKLAFEVTKLVHGEKDATEAMNAAKTLFASGGAGENEGSVPICEIKKDALEKGIDIITVLEMAKFVGTKSEGRRLIAGGGVKIGETKIDSIEYNLTLDSFGAENSILLQKGKKGFCKLIIV